MNKHEKVISITTKGIITNYPQKNINFKKSRVINAIIIFESDKDLIRN